MATKKPVKEDEGATVEEISEVQETAAEAEPVIDDPWAEEVEMIIPRKPKGDDQQYYICVNDRRFYVPANGKMQKLPKPVAEILKQSLEAEAEADDYADHIPNKTGPFDR